MKKIVGIGLIFFVVGALRLLPQRWAVPVLMWLTKAMSGPPPSPEEAVKEINRRTAERESKMRAPYTGRGLTYKDMNVDAQRS